MSDRFDNSSGKDDWMTPWPLVRYAERIIGRPFYLDLAANEQAAKASRWVGPGAPWEDALDYTRRVQEATRGRVYGAKDRPIWCNPPYSRVAGGIYRWLEACHTLATLGFPVCALTFARTDTKAFHTFAPTATELHLLQGRVRFIDPATNEPRHPAQAPSCLFFWIPGPQPVRAPRFILVEPQQWRG